MKIFNLEEIKYTLQNIMHRKTRTFLTVLSILIGMAAVFALISFGLGIGNYVEVLKEEQGADKLFVQAKGVGAPGTDENFFISKDDIEFIGKIKGVDDIMPFYMKPGEIRFKDETRYVFISGLDPGKIRFMEKGFGIDIIKGRSLRKGDDRDAVMGYSYQFENKVFKRALKLGDKFEINGVLFDVIGFYDQVGNPNDDSSIYITDEAIEFLYPSIKDKFGFALLSSEKEVDPEILADRIEEKLRKHKGQDEGKEDFFVQTFADAIATFGIVINVINGILVLIALVSVFVAAVNIMNTMYTAVLERTREIGIMKAIGARNSDILFIFVFESGMLGMIGGVFGITLGYLVAKTGGTIAAAAGYSSLQPIFPVSLIIGCLSFAIVVGTLSGLFPAIQASKLRPVDALRYE